MLPFTIRFTRLDAEPVPRGARAPGAVRAAFASLVGASVVLLSVAGAAPAAAGNGTIATVNIGVRSVSVSPGSVTYSTCVDALGSPTGSLLVFPNGSCNTPTLAPLAITITVGPIASHIDVQGSDMVPADNGTHWTLVGGAANVDQFRETTVGPTSFTVLSTAPTCDKALPGGPIDPCGLMGGASATENLSMIGPFTSTDTSLTFTTTVTWTAVP